jgi:hypothetical protein
MFSIIFNLLGVGLLVVMVYLLLKAANAGAAAGICLVAAALSLLVANFDRIETLKLSPTGIEAKTREFQGVIDDAKATVASLHELAVAAAALQVDMLASAGRFGGGETIRHKDEMKDQLLQRLKALGLTKEQLSEVDQADRKWVVLDYAFAVLGPLNGQKDPEAKAAYAKAFNDGNPPTPDDCAALLQQFHVNDAKTNELLEDYRYYFRTGEQRRPEVWRDRANW